MTRDYSLNKILSKPIDKMTEAERAYLKLEVERATAKLPPHIKNNPQALMALSVLAKDEALKKLPKEEPRSEPDPSSGGYTPFWDGKR